MGKILLRKHNIVKPKGSREIPPSISLIVCFCGYIHALILKIDPYNDFRITHKPALTSHQNGGIPFYKRKSIN